LTKGDDNVVVDLLLEDGTLYNEKGTLQFSDVTVDETTGSITLRAIFPNPKEVLLPGMFVRARIQEGVKVEAILAPQQGITRNAQGQATALLVDDKNKVVERTLITEQAIGDQWLIRSGLKEGDKLIVSGLQKVKPGMTVRTEEVEETKNKAAADKAPNHKENN
ncbi:efflux RND transporter periplasmic adaptor subunit, partial [Legionella sp. 29fVS95]